MYARCIANESTCTFNAHDMDLYRSCLLEEIVNRNVSVVAFNESTESRLDDKGVCRPTRVDQRGTKWTLTDTRLNGVHMVAWATMSQKDFPSGRNAQCTAISALAIVHLCLRKHPLNRPQMDQLMIEGNSYYDLCREVASAQFLDPMESLSPIKIDGLHVSFNVYPISYGAFDGNCNKTLAAAILRGTEKRSKKDIGRVGFLVVGHTKTVSFVPTFDSRYLYFNSHCVNKNNQVEQENRKGKARLFRCLSAEALTDVVLVDHPRNGQLWQLYELVLDID